MREKLKIGFWLAAGISFCATASLVVGGAATLLVEDLADGPAAMSPELDRRVASNKMGVEMFSSASDGSPILERNMFDSAVGPISRGGVQDIDGPGNGPDADPFGRVSPCPDDAPALFTSVATSTRESSIALLRESDDKVVTVAEGDVVGDYTVVRIGWRYVVLVSRRETSCYLDLYGLDDVVYLPVGDPVSGRRSGRLIGGFDEVESSI